MNRSQGRSRNVRQEGRGMGPAPRNKGASKYSREKQADAARLLAARTLMAVDEDGQFANLVLPKMLRQQQVTDPGFDRQDSAFTSELVYGTTRRQGTIDWVLGEHSSKPLEELDAAVRACLRLGTYQLMYMRVPDHAAIGETVSVARELGGEAPSRFVNAVLRSIQREGTQSIEERILEIPDYHQRLGIQYSHPEWVVSAFAQSLDAHRMGDAELEPALQANNQAALVTLTARPSLITAAELADEAEDILQTVARQGALSPYAVALEAGDPGALPSIRSGAAGVQDEGSQIAALLLANAPLEGPAQQADEKWLDLCAGPGGKAALLAAMGREAGVKLTANEISPHRARLLERSVQALDNVEITVADGTRYRGRDTFDRVLVDAPCLGLGSLRRRPESRWRHKPSDLDELVPLQRELLQAAISVTKEGGVIAWVTCSPHVSETLRQVAGALALGSVELVDAAALAQSLVPGGIELPAPGPEADRPGTLDYIAARTVQLWPHVHGTDAMFVALLRKMRASDAEDK